MITIILKDGSEIITKQRNYTEALFFNVNLAYARTIKGLIAFNPLKVTNIKRG